MIGALRGEVLELETSGEQSARMILDVHGVGYDVTISARLASSLSAFAGPVAIAVHTHVREGAIQLYGFPDQAERRTFEMLLTAHGVGPALAMAVLNAMTPAALMRALAIGDLDALTAVPGVGKRTAQRLQLELAQRLDVAPEAPGADASELDATALSEVREALAALGYGPDEIRRATRELERDAPVEVLLREALNSLAPAR